MKEDIKSTLSATSINQYLHTDELDFIVSHSEIKIFSEGETIIQQGKKSKGIYILVEGSVTVCTKLLGEGEICLAHLQPGNYFGEISIIGRLPCIASFIADKKVKCFLINKIFFNNLGLFFPKIKYQILQAICNDMSARYRCIHAEIVKTIEQCAMKKQSFFSEMIESLNKTSQISLENVNNIYEQMYHTQFFDVFTENEINELSKYWVSFKAPKNTSILKEGDKYCGCYIVLQGAVQANIIHNNKIAKISVLGPLKFFNPISIIEPNYPSPISYITCERAILLHIPEKNIAHLQKNQILIWYKFFDLISASFALLERATNELDVRLRTELYNR